MNELIQKTYFSDEMLTKQPHYHDCHQIILIKRGHIQFSINGTKYKASSGNIVIFSRYENHSLTVLSEEYERYVLQLSPRAGEIRGDLYALLSSRPDGFCNAIDVSGQTELFEALFQQIIFEHGRQDKLREDMLKLLVSRLLILLYRRLPDTAHFEQHHAQMVFDIQRQFETDCSATYTLEELARRYSVSPSSLSHRFKKLTGASVMGYLLSCRIATAKHLLSATGEDIAAIVEKCGFSDSSNFSRTFKKLCGCSPTDFRRQYRP